MLPVLKKILAFPILVLVWVYRNMISPFTVASCRYAPSCSEYMAEAIKEWGPFKGFWLGIKRISTCHPWGGHGFDPVPKKEK
ncbi:MAG: membrane protein insertion efficiency factor YidD [Schleiferiaceae bacterium]|jgi:putative membrane protein insertion efficiency factor|nr:membrane protein insertion efficiency factor YidD [Schleiferiaceae bacterium]